MGTFASARAEKSAVSVPDTDIANTQAKFGNDLTPAGRPRVHQELPGSNLYFY